MSNLNIPDQRTRRQQEDELLDASLPDIEADIEIRDEIIARLIQIWDFEAASAHSAIKFKDGLSSEQILRNFHEFESNIHRLMNILWPKESTSALERRRVTRQYPKIVKLFAHDDSLTELLLQKYSQVENELGVVAAADLS